MAVGDYSLHSACTNIKILEPLADLGGRDGVFPGIRLILSMQNNKTGTNEPSVEHNNMISAAEILDQSDTTAWQESLPPLLSDPDTLKAEIRQHFHQSLGREFSDATANYIYSALAMTVRDRLMNC